MTPSARSIVRRLAELVIIGLGIFALLELSARVYLFGFSGLIPARINSEHSLPQTGFTRPTSLPGLPFELKPNLDGYFKLAPFRTNSQGLRDREYTPRKPDGCFRVAVVGSSFAMPTGVAIEDAFHSLLEERLSVEFAPMRYQFVNFAVGMFNAEHMLVMLEGRALDYDPDLILLTITKLSAPGAAAPEAALPPGRQAPRDLPRFERTFPILQSFFVRLVSSRLFPDAPPRVDRVGWLERRFLDLRARLEPEPETPDARPQAAPVRGRDGDLLDQLAAIRSDTGIPIVVVRLELEPVPKLPHELELEAKARRLAIPYLDTREAFRDIRNRDLWIHELDPHPNPRAHAIFADTVERFLRAEALLPGAAS